MYALIVYWFLKSLVQFHTFFLLKKHRVPCFTIASTIIYLNTNYLNIHITCKPQGVLTGWLRFDHKQLWLLPWLESFGIQCHRCFYYYLQYIYIHIYLLSIYNIIYLISEYRSNIRPPRVSNEAPSIRDACEQTQFSTQRVARHFRCVTADWFTEKHTTTAS